jgi:LacI family transcriptional regulator
MKASRISAMKNSRARSSRKSSSPTMVQVAEAAGVSIFTVSAVLNGSAVVSDELRRRVEEAIQKTGYKRNILARGLKTGETRTVGLTVGDINNPFYTGVVSVIQQALHRAGYAVMLCCSDRDAILQAEQIELLRNRMVDGLIISPFGDDDQLRSILKDTNIPVVLIDRILEGVDCDSVVLDNRAAVMEATRYVLGLGHRRIGFISGTLESFTGRERLEGYYAALDEAGIAREDSLVQLGDFREEGAYDAAIQLLTSADPPTALFSSNNLMMIGTVRALRDLGLNCPEDVSVTGIDDFPWADLFRPHLTTVAQPLRAIGEQAANLLLKRLTGKTDEPARHIVLKGSLVVRGSCRARVGADTSAAGPGRGPVSGDPPPS